MLERIREFNRGLPTDQEFGEALAAALRFFGRSAAGLGSPPGATGADIRLPLTQLVDFATAVDSGRELLRAQIPATRGALGPKLEGISTVGGRLAVESGRATTLDDGIVLFHEAITVDKPSLRRILRKVDEKAGRRKPFKVTEAQRLARLAMQAGLVVRGSDGRVKRFKPAARAKINRAKGRAASARRKATIKRQAAALKRLRGRR